MKNGWDELWELSVSVTQWTWANGLLLCILVGLPAKHRCIIELRYLLPRWYRYLNEISRYTYTNAKSRNLWNHCLVDISYPISAFKPFHTDFKAIYGGSKWKRKLSVLAASRLIQDGAKGVLLHICRLPYLSHVSCKVLCPRGQWDLVWPCALMHCIVALVFCDV